MQTNQIATNGNGDTVTRAQSFTLAPRVDIFENADELLVVTDLPGVRGEDVKIEYQRERLTLEASRADGPERGEVIAGDDRWYRYARSFQVTGVDADRIHAEMNDGVLTVHLPKAEAAKPRKIPVKAG